MPPENDSTPDQPATPEPPRIAQVLGQSAPPRELKLGNVAQHPTTSWRKRWLSTGARLESAKAEGWTYHSEKLHRNDETGNPDYSYTCGANYCRCMQ